MLTINTYHGAYNRSKRAGGLGAIVNFVDHYTGGTGSAKNNCIYFATGDRKASADVFVDKDGAIWEYNNVLDGYNTWGVGDGRGRYGITNTNSINVEVVSAGEPYTDAQVSSLAALYEHYCSVLGKRLNHVRHYDASRKRCPAPYVDEAAWAGLRARVEGGDAPDVRPPAPAEPSPAPQPTGSDWVRRLQAECNAQGFSNQVVDGIPGPNTLAGCPQLGRSSRGKITALMQERLISLGYSCGGCGADGANGPGTQAAIKAYQRDRGLSADGIIGPNTWRALLGL